MCVLQAQVLFPSIKKKKKKNYAVAIESLLLQTQSFKSPADGRLLVTGAIKEACARFGGFFFFFPDKPHQTDGGGGVGVRGEKEEGGFEQVDRPFAPHGQIFILTDHCFKMSAAVRHREGCQCVCMCAHMRLIFKVQTKQANQ